MKFRWSLRTEVIVVLFVGYLLVLWQWREPWRFERKYVSSKLELLKGHMLSPDRSCLFRCAYLNSVELYRPLEDGREIEIQRLPVSAKGGRFLDAETLLFLEKSIGPKIQVDDPNEFPASEYYYVEFKRHFPCEWWGHFYRPEVWLLPLWLGLIVWTIRKDRAVAR